MAARTTKSAQAPNSVEDQTLRYAVAALEQRVEALEAGRPGRKAKPLVALRQDGVCAVSPDIDSGTCPDASIFRYQQGCHGTKCKAKQHAAYERRKATKDTIDTPVAPPKRAAAKKAPAKTNGVKSVAKKAPARKRALAAVATG